MTIVLPKETNGQTQATTIRTATQSDRLYMRHLSRKFTLQLGYLPDQAFDQYIAWGCVIIGELNGAQAGYVLSKHRAQDNQGITSIFQAAVQLDARRGSLGRLLVEATIAKAISFGNHALSLWCAEGLEANEFWPACGFSPIALRTGGTQRKRLHICWRRGAIDLANFTSDINNRRRGSAGAPLLLPSAVTADEIIKLNRAGKLCDLHDQLLKRPCGSSCSSSGSTSELLWPDTAISRRAQAAQ